MDADKEARIRQRAYEIWQRQGQPQGREAEHWRQAEAEIMAEAGAAVEQGADVAPAGKPQGEAPAPQGAPLRNRRASPKPQRTGSDMAEDGPSPRSRRRGKPSNR